MSAMSELHSDQQDDIREAELDDFLAYVDEQQRIKEYQQLDRVSEATASTH